MPLTPQRSLLASGLPARGHADSFSRPTTTAVAQEKRLKSRFISFYYDYCERVSGSAPCCYLAPTNVKENLWLFVLHYQSKRIY